MPDIWCYLSLAETDSSALRKPGHTLFFVCSEKRRPLEGLMVHTVVVWAGESLFRDRFMLELLQTMHGRKDVTGLIVGIDD